MKEFFPTLHAAALFSGISDDELATLLSCLGARIDTFPNGSRLLRAGEAVEEVGAFGEGADPRPKAGKHGGKLLIGNAGEKRRGVEYRKKFFHKKLSFVENSTDLLPLV